MSDHYPAWQEPATKGDLVRLGVMVYSIATDIANINVAIVQDHNDEAARLLHKHLEQLRQLSTLISELGGKEMDDE